MTTRAMETEVAHVKLGTDTRQVAAGPTSVAALKAALGVDATDILYLKDGPSQRVLGEDEVIDVRSGMHFEAVPGGGVS